MDQNRLRAQMSVGADYRLGHPWRTNETTSGLRCNNLILQELGLRTEGSSNRFPVRVCVEGVELPQG